MFHDHFLYVSLYPHVLSRPHRCTCPKCKTTADLTSLGGGYYECSNCGIQDAAAKVNSAEQIKIGEAFVCGWRLFKSMFGLKPKTNSAVQTISTSSMK